MAKDVGTTRSVARSAVDQSQADVRAGNGAVIYRHDDYVDDVQPFGAIRKNI